MDRGAGGLCDMLWQNMSTELSTDAGVGGSYGDLASSKRNELKFCIYEHVNTRHNNNR